MSNKKQTAVEWLYKQLNGLNKPILDDYFQIVFSQAKEMEKQQIIEAANQNDFVLVPGFGIYEDLSAGVQFYKHTYET
jgi:hypothetical protein